MTNPNVAYWKKTKVTCRGVRLDKWTTKKIKEALAKAEKRKQDQQP